MRLNVAARAGVRTVECSRWRRAQPSGVAMAASQGYFELSSV